MNDSQLIQDYLSGKQDCLETLLEKHLQRIFSACYRVCLDEQDANDITQNVLIKIIRYLPKFQQKSNFSTWYYRIAYNESLSYLKKQKTPLDISAYENTIPSNENIPWKLLQDMLGVEVTQHVNTLPVLERNIILYYYYDNLKIKEIAHILDLNENTIKTKLSRSKKILSTQLSHLWNK